MTVAVEERRKGNQRPTLVREPQCPLEHVNTFDAEDAVEFAARFGLILDPWQDELCHLWMRRDDRTGRWLAGTWGIAVPRQNGKNGTLVAVELYMAIFLRLKILHTAHQVKTAQKHFRELKSYFGTKANDPFAPYPELNRLVKEIRSTNGQEAIFLWDPDSREPLGSIEISARSKGSARGFTNDVLVIDEAQHLKDEHLEALRPAISAAPSGDPVAIYMGTPPKKGALLDDGEGAAFLRVRARAVTGDSVRSAWMEFGLDIDLDVMTEDEIRAVAQNTENWYTVNPALGRRLWEQTLIDELDELGARSFCRERLNVWPSAQAISSQAFDVAEWDGATVPRAPDGIDLDAIGLCMDSLGRMWMSVASRTDAGGVHIELLPLDPLGSGQDHAVQWLWERCRKRRPIVFASDSGATVLEAPLRAKGMKVYRLNSAETVQMSAGFVRGVVDGELSHLADPVLEKAVAESGRTTLSNGLWIFGRNGDMSGAPLYAVACARFGAVKWAGRRRSGKSRFG